VQSTAIPAEFLAGVDQENGPGYVLDLAVEDGRVVCNRVSVVRRPNAPPLKATQLRYAFDKLAREAAAVVAVTVNEIDTNGRFHGRRHDGSVSEFLAEYDSASKRTTRRGSRMPDSHLQEVARVYREALAAKKPPVQAVQRHFRVGGRPVSRSTAGRWVFEARRRGFLGPTQPGQAGEATTTKRRK